jgi:hypothetical protein
MPRGIAIGVFAVVNELGFQSAEETLDWRIVPAVSLAAHRLGDVQGSGASSGVASSIPEKSGVRQVQQIGRGEREAGSFQINSDIPLFDRQHHPFAPTCLRAERRAQRQSRMPQAPAEPARSVLDQVSAVLG